MANYGFQFYEHKQTKFANFIDILFGINLICVPFISIDNDN